MADKSGGRAKKRIGTHMRGAASAAYGERSKSTAHIVSTYSLKLREDFIATSKLRFLHFLLMESNPAVRRIIYNPSAILPAECQEGADVIALTSGGVVEIRKFLSDSTKPADTLYAAFDACVKHLNSKLPEGFVGAQKFEFVPIDLKNIWVGNEIRLRNWCRLLVCYHECSTYSLRHSSHLFIEALREKDVLSIAEIRKICPDEHEFALMLAAATEECAFGRCTSDLNKFELSENTRFRFIE